MPTALLVNDDGIESPGLLALRRVVESFNFKAIVVAPLEERSGTSIGLTLAEDIRVTEYAPDDEFFGYACSGTPVDCVKIALGHILRDSPDVVFSGINRGGNLGVHCLYSGTVGAAIEAFINGIPAVAISKRNFLSDDFTESEKMLRKVMPVILGAIDKTGGIFNVNLPDLEKHEVRGHMWTFQDPSPFVNLYEDKFDDEERARVFTPVYAPLAATVSYIENNRSDHEAVGAGYISITPLDPYLTNKEDLKKLQ
ncbi:MAG: 5'/3'-nucleotidase SurE [Planctomycetes bacterium]|nr:5'/3'-nucleotidase SurE [Planctomycetota bacterium]